MDAPLLDGPASTPCCSSPTSLKTRAGGIVALLVLANAACLGALALVAHAHPKFASPGILALTFGLRHAVDADHIAAIDNVSRRLIADGQKPLLVGFWFSLGHSTVVVLLCAGVAFGSTYLRKHLDNVKSIGAIVGTSVSATVLLLVAGMNIFVAWRLVRQWRAQRAACRSDVTAAGDDGYHVHVTTFGSVLEHTHMVAVDENGEAVDGPGGLFSNCCPKLFGAVNTPLKMYPIGFLFGLGFDTASEVALLGLTAMGSSTAHGTVPAWAIMVLPCLFAAGMSLIDTLDGMMMLWAYSWAQLDPAKRILFNLFLTCVSAFIALVVAVVEILGLVQAQLGLKGSWFWDQVAAVNAHFEYVGYSILGFFAASCLVAVVAYRCCLGDGGDGAEGSVQRINIQSQSREVVAVQSAAKLKGGMDDYLRGRMLGLARGNNVQAIEI